MAASSTSKKARSTAASAAKKTAVKKTARKIGGKQPVKASVKAKAATQSNKAKKLTLQEQLTQLETRLKRANATTRKNVKTLETFVTTLEAQSKTARNAQKAAFTRQINKLNEKLTSLMADSQTEIAKELSNAMNAPRKDDGALETLEAALARADDRLAQTEIAQANAITKINRHLANLASALETRFETETAARTAAMSATETKLEQLITDKTGAVNRKIEAIETDTAAALEALGGKIESFAVELGQRQSRIDTNIGEKVSEIALQTQAEFETFRSNVDQRLTDISSLTPVNTVAGHDTRLDGQMNLLQDRLQNLEQYLADMKLQPPAAQATAPQLAPPMQSPQLAPPLPKSTHSSAPLPSNVVPITDAFAPVAANPYAPHLVTPADSAIEKPAKKSHIPVEFDPATYQAVASNPAPAPQSLQAPFPTHQQTSPANLSERPHLTPQALMPSAQPNMQPLEPAPMLPPALPPVGASGEHSAQDFMDTPSPTALADLLPDSDLPDAKLPVTHADRLDNYVEPALPYSDPAYAENNDMRAERIGGPDKVRKLPKFTGGKLPVSGRNLKLLLIGGAVAVLALFASKMVLGSGDRFAPIPEQAAQFHPQGSSPIQTADGPNQAAGRLLNTNAKDGINVPIGGPTQSPIGTYTENTTPVLNKAAANTLEGAAENGNPIAMYQLGMTRLEAGETDAGVKLIRNAAAQNLPAAQYRLAKLYEIGQGVGRDEVQARQLTERAAKSGHRIAMHDLAHYYTDGRGGVEVNVATAAGWFEQAAQFGVVDSQFNLAVLTEAGQGVARDIDTAYFWYSVAAAQGDQFAQKRVELIAPSLSPEQLDAANARIAAFTPRAVNPNVNGVFPDAPWNKPVQSVKIEQIRRAQSYLAELGYDVGTPDGAMGPNTRAAITEFEKANALPETGAVDETLIDKLELAVGA